MLSRYSFELYNANTDIFGDITKAIFKKKVAEKMHFSKSNAGVIAHWSQDVAGQKENFIALGYSCSATACEKYETDHATNYRHYWQITETSSDYISEWGIERLNFSFTPPLP